MSQQFTYSNINDMNSATFTPDKRLQVEKNEVIDW